MTGESAEAEARVRHAVAIGSMFRFRPGLPAEAGLRENETTREPIDARLAGAHKSAIGLFEIPAHLLRGNWRQEENAGIEILGARLAAFAAYKRLPLPQIAEMLLVRIPAGTKVNAADLVAPSHAARELPWLLVNTGAATAVEIGFGSVGAGAPLGFRAKNRLGLWTTDSGVDQISLADLESSGEVEWIVIRPKS